MKRILMTAIVSIIMTGSVAAAGYGLEADRMEAGRRFDEQQFSAPLAVQISGEFKRAADATYNAEARDHSKLEAKAPPLPEAVPAEDGKDGAPAPVPAPAPAPAAGGTMMSGISGVKLVVILAISALVVLLVIGGGMPLAAVSPVGAAALFVAGAVALGAIVAHAAEAPDKPEE